MTNIQNIKDLINEIDKTTKKIDNIHVEIDELKINVIELQDKKNKCLDKIKENLLAELCPTNCEINVDYFWSNHCLILIFENFEEVNVGSINAIAQAFGKTLDNIGLKTTKKGVYIHIYF